MMKIFYVLLLFFVWKVDIEAKSKRPKKIIISQEGLCFSNTETVGKRKLKRYMFAGDDGIVYKITNSRYLTGCVGKEVFLTGTVKKKENKDGTIVHNLMPKTVNLIVSGKIYAKLSKKTKRWISKLTTSDDNVYVLTGKPKSSIIAKEFNGKILKLWGKLLVKKLKNGKPRKYIQVSGFEGEKPKKSKRSKKKDSFAKSDKKFSAEELKPGSTISMSLPELGNSASSKNSKPIEMTLFLPDNYAVDKKHPVIIHMSGGFGSSKGAAGWKKVTDNKNFILIGADYSHKDNKEKDLLKLGTCRDFDFKIAAHCLQILKNSTAIDEKTVILAGVSSGGYSITYSLGCRNTDIFAGFCPIIGGTDRCEKADIGDSSILFIAGENDNQYDRTKLVKEAVKVLKKKNPNVKLYIQKGVGHSWDSQSYPVQKEWLFSKFENLAKYKRWLILAENSESPEVKKYFSEKIQKSWFKCPSDLQ